MSAHTPGPWNNDDGIIYPPDDCDGQVWIADVRSAYNREANARLIAAAPELYECVRLYVEHRRAIGQSGTALDAMAERALAKVADA